MKCRNWIERKLCYDSVRFAYPKLLWRIVETVARVLLVDSCFLSMLREVRWLSVLEKNLLSLSNENEDLYTSKLVHALLLLWDAFKQTDLSEDSVLLREFLQNILFHPSIHSHFGQDDIVAIHNAVIRDFTSLTRAIPVDSYIDWLRRTQLTNETSAMEVLKWLAEHSDSFAPFYRGFALIACEENPFPAILFLLFSSCDE